MTLNFPTTDLNDGDIHDPGNGNRYVWNGDHWDKVEKELKGTLPIDLDRGTDDQIYHLIDLTQLTEIP